MPGNRRDHAIERVLAELGSTHRCTRSYRQTNRKVERFGGR